ncbi:MAG TPA: DUF4837 family protein [Longimicrobiales bacterium]|nr:DUF4837 family protein [Longimicrobiales bacterium]
MTARAKATRSALLFGALALLGCDGASRQAVGGADRVIVIAEDSLWNAIGDSLMAVLEPRVFTVRDERTFEVTRFSPFDPVWRDRRMFRNVLVIGPADAAWVEPVLGAGSAQDVNGVVQARDVWARNQRVTALVAADANAALTRAPLAAAAIDSVFRADVLRRMYTSSPDTLLRDTLRATHGFGILLPQVYASLAREPGLVLYQNSTSVGGDLVRSVLITFRDGSQTPTQEAALAWRDSIGASAYRPPHTTDREHLRSAPVSVHGSDGIEVQGVWAGNDPSWPTGGPFLTRMMTCPARNRTYLLDAWVFAPGPNRSKYEYLIQLHTILNTFEC